MKTFEAQRGTIARELYDEVASTDFPLAIVQLAEKINQHPLYWLKHQPGICHRCNNVEPGLLWVSSSWHTKFAQRWGWYIRQERLRFGIGGDRFFTLDSEIPPLELQQAIDHFARVRLKHERERKSLREGPEPSLWTEMIERKLATADLDHELAVATKRLWQIPESNLRGFLGRPPPRPKTSRGERSLVQVVKTLFPVWTVFQSYRPAWLDELELDAYLPELRLGFEYQGEQHFEAIDAWGGSQALDQQQSRDKKKVARCAAVGVTLVVVNHWEPITPEHITKRLLEVDIEPPAP